MPLLNPLALLGLLFIPAVIAMYMLKLRRDEAVVPSTLLWTRLLTDVGCAHAGGRVDDKDDVARESGGTLEERPCGEQHQDQDEQELEQQQEASPEPLPGRVRLDVGKQAIPQQR